MNNPLNIGDIVYSKSGRDSGSYYLVLEVLDDKYVHIADGEIRKIDKPKRKKNIHLKQNGENLSKIAIKLKNGDKVYNSELRSALRSYNEIK